MVNAIEEVNRLMLRARDAIDGDFALVLDLPKLARVAHMSEAHFLRSFKSTFGETPHRYLQRRRIERAMYLLRTCLHATLRNAGRQPVAPEQILLAMTYGVPQLRTRRADDHDVG